MYPNSSFLTFTRLTIAVSFSTQKWSNNIIGKLIEHWLICHTRYINDQKFLKSDLVIKYEDFCSNPNSIVLQISKWLATDIVIPEDVENVKNMNAKYFKMWEDYQKGFFTRFIALRIINKYETKLNAFGYSMVTLNTNT